MLKKLRVWWSIRKLWRVHHDFELQRVVDDLVDLGDMDCVMPLMNLALDRPALRHAPNPWAGDVRCKVMALEGLKKLGVAGVLRLIEALRDEDEKVRSLAADILGTLKDKRAVTPLITSMSDLSSAVRRMAARALGEIKDAGAADALVSALRDSDEQVRWSAAWALAEIGDGRAFEPLVKLLLVTNKFARQRSAGALGTLGDKRAIKPLTDAFNAANDDEFRNVIAYSLARLGEDNYRQLLLKETQAKALAQAAEAKAEAAEAKAKALAKAARNKAAFATISAQLAEGMSYAAVVALLGAPSQTIDPSALMGGFGKVSMIRSVGSIPTSAIMVVEWKRDEGSYRATFTNGILTEINSSPSES